MEFRKAEAIAGLRGRDSSRKVFNLVLSAGSGNDLSETIEVSKNDQTKINQAIERILPVFKGMDHRLVFAILADIGIMVSKDTKDFL